MLWIAFGLVSVTLYFAYQMTFELRAADHRVAGLEADVAIAGAARYASNLIATTDTPGALPEPLTYEAEDVPLGGASFWFLGRATDNNSTLSGTAELPVFSLADESGKLNLNTATAAMLLALPRMTLELAAAIVDWRDADSNPSENGAEDEIYLRLNPPYQCKNAPFESVEELRLVYGMDLEILYGEDTNLNGILDPNENDGETSPPTDNRDGRLDPGLVEYLTVATREPNTRSDGSPRIDVTGQDRTELESLLKENFGDERANDIRARVTAAGTVRSLMEFYLRSGMTGDEFDQVYPDLTATNAAYQEGLINVNTAPEAVLMGIPGIGTNNASLVIAHRLSQSTTLTSFTWLPAVIGTNNALQAGPYLTARSYQFTADVVALGHLDRGYRRVRFLLDASEGTPVVRWRQDLTHRGWALGHQVRSELDRTRETRAQTSTRTRTLTRAL